MSTYHKLQQHDQVDETSTPTDHLDEAFPDTQNARIAETLQDPRISTWSGQTAVELGDLPVKTPVRMHTDILSHGTLEHRLLDVIIDVTLVLLPSLFIVLGVLSLALNGKDSDDSSLGRAVLDFSKISGTLYPIIFASIVSRFLHKVALWSAERGTTIGLLETLIRSQSFASSITTAFSLQTFNIVSLLVLIIWILSPIGGQSSLRVISTVQYTQSDNATVYFANSNYPGYLALASSHDDDSILTAASGIFRASLLAPSNIVNSSRDTWGHAKVPLVPEVVDLQNAPVGKWLSIGKNDSVDYSSLLGVPMWNVPSRGQINFTMPWNFMVTPCTRTNITYGPYCDLLHHVDGFRHEDITYQPGNTSYPCNINRWKEINFFSASFNGSRLPTDGGKTPSYINMTFMVSPYLAQGYDALMYSMNRIRGLRYDCQLHDIHLNVSMTCEDGACRADALSRVDGKDWVNILNQARSDGSDPTDWADSFSTVIANFNKSINAYTAHTPVGHQTDTAAQFFYLNDPSSWWGISEGDFSQQLALMWNSYFTALRYNTEATSDITGDINDQVKTTENYSNGASDGNFWRASSKALSTKAIYQIQPTWLALLFLTTFAMEVCAILSVVFAHYTRAPDILGYVSTLTKDSPYFKHVKNNSTLSGQERSFSIRGMKVQIADVCSEKEFGHVAFVCIDGKNQQQVFGGRLANDRLYV